MVKKIIKITLLSLLIIATILGGAMSIVRDRVSTNVPSVPILKIDEKTKIAPSVNWVYPYLWNLNRFKYTSEPPAIQNSYHITNKNTINVALDTTNYIDSIKIGLANDVIFEGNVDDLNSYVFEENGTYLVQIVLDQPQDGIKEYGTLIYNFEVSIDVPPPPPPDPVLLTTASTVTQGDTIAIELENIPQGTTPQIVTDLAATPFMPLDEGKWTSYIGISDAHETGDFQATVTFGDVTETIPITVTAGKFDRQDLIINTSDPVISEANSDAAYKQFRETIPPFYETTDPNLYWSGNFIMPTEGRISSKYGLLRYTNGGTTPRRHAGIDIAIDEGTPIKAPANGKVVFSDYLLNTGNTMVIEHGGGLKTYYYHMVERVAQKDDTVKQGDIVGKVGTTGYSTGPHLHFEVRIGNQNLDPFKFFEGTGGCFTAKQVFALN